MKIFNSSSIFKSFKLNLNLLFKIGGIGFLAMVSQTLIAPDAFAGTPLTTKETFSGKYNYTVTGGTLRSDNDSIENRVNASNLNSSSNAQLSGIPSNATVKKAYLYWSGSGINVDNQITLDGTSLTADNIYTDNFSPKKYKKVWSSWYERYVSIENGNYDLNFFQGVKDVTNIVSAKGNGNYNFENLTVDNSGDYLATSTTLSAWSLIVIYEDPSIARNELNTIKLYEGFKASAYEQVDFTLDGIRVAANPIAKFSMLIWEGDESIEGTSEYFSFNQNNLIDSYNPSNNQFNSSINTLQSTNTYGVDLDTFDVSNYVMQGATSITGTISTHNDLVFQGASLIMVTDELANQSPSAQPDLIITDEDTAGTYNLITGDANGNGRDSDPEGDSLTVTKFSVGGTEYTFDAQTTNHQVVMPSGAILTIASDGEVSYDPAGKFESFKAGDKLDAQDEFTYTVSDDSGETSSARAVLDIDGVADNPIANDDIATTDENTVIKIDVLDNDRDPDSDKSDLSVIKINNIPLVIGIPVLLNESTGASISLNDDGTINYDPTGSLSLDKLSTGQNSQDTFTYTVKDEVGNIDTGSVTTTVNGITDTFPD